MSTQVDKRLLRIFFLVFTLSGFSGLIYESIWTHYLKLFLGHAAYAQTLVLAIFMGGLALGSWICSRYSLRWKSLLIGYALAEGAIGLFALVFHTLFDQAVQISYTSVIPFLNSATAANMYKWSLSALMILPQSILLGMTFPLMSAGIIRQSPETPGKTIALLYFTNSIGAAVGVLASSFVLIRLLGLPWTIRTAGLINIALALCVWVLMRGRPGDSPDMRVENSIPEENAGGSPYFLFLAASCITGAASFIYEIGWIRMLSLVLGSSTHAFELMLSAFIFGLAFGGLWMQRSIDRIGIPGRYLAFVQIIMGLLALSTLPIYGRTFDVMQWLVQTLSKTDSGYTLFNLSSNAIALSVMLPTTFCAGMTLPLITFALLKQGYGERSIGAVYAANTVGAIIGVFFAIHVGMPILGLKGLLTAGASLDISLGLLLLWSAARSSSKRLPILAAVLCVCIVASTFYLVKLDRYKMASGVYRFGLFLTAENSRLLYHEDGKTSTVSVTLLGNGVMSIRTNGKSDAGINMRPSAEAFADEATMTLAAVIPMALHPQARTVANIGFGSGLTTHTLLSNPLIAGVDTVEIERKMVEAANYFRPRVELAYTDPRSALYIDDAKSFFSVHRRKYDIIISEPSNPWVSGVSGLFSQEFYRQMNNHLAANGLFVQWVQLYEMDTNLIASILKAMSSSYADFVVYAADDGDMIIVARRDGMISEPDSAVLKIPGIAEELHRVRIEGVQDLDIRKLGNKKLLGNMLESFSIRANSDYYPVLDQNAARIRFLQANAQELLTFSHAPLPVLKMLSPSHSLLESTDITPSPDDTNSRYAHIAMVMRDYLLKGRSLRDDPPAVQQQALQFKEVFCDCRSVPDQVGRLSALFNVSYLMTSYLTPQELSAIWKKMESCSCARSLSTAEKNWVRLFKAVGSRDASSMAESAKVLLASTPEMPPALYKYCVASEMLGSLMQGRREDALKLWQTHRPLMYGNSQPDLLFRLLATESGSSL